MKTLRQAILTGVNVNATDGDGLTPLHLACIHGRLAMVKILVRHGASMAAVDVSGRTPLELVNVSYY